MHTASIHSTMSFPPTPRRSRCRMVWRLFHTGKAVLLIVMLTVVGSFPQEYESASYSGQFSRVSTKRLQRIGLSHAPGWSVSKRIWRSDESTGMAAYIEDSVM